MNVDQYNYDLKIRGIKGNIYLQNGWWHIRFPAIKLQDCQEVASREDDRKKGLEFHQEQSVKAAERILLKRVRVAIKKRKSR